MFLIPTKHIGLASEFFEKVALEAEKTIAHRLVRFESPANQIKKQLASHV